MQLTVANGVNRLMYPVSNVDVNEDADTQESDLFSSIGAATEPEIGQYWGHTNFTTGILNEELPYLLYGMFPTSKTSTPYEDVTQADIAVPTSGECSDPPTGIHDPATAARPAKIKLAFAAAPGAGTLEVRGYIRIGPGADNVRFRRETVTLGAGTAYETENYFINTATYPLTMTAAGVTTTGNVTPTWDPELFTIDFEITNPDVSI